jgi:hypothetical protein
LLLSRTSSSVRHKNPATSEKGIPRATALSKNNRSGLSQYSPGGRHSSSMGFVIFVLDCRSHLRIAKRFWDIKVTLRGTRITRDGRDYFIVCGPKQAQSANPSALTIKGSAGAIIAQPEVNLPSHRPAVSNYNHRLRSDAILRVAARPSLPRAASLTPGPTPPAGFFYLLHS